MGGGAEGRRGGRQTRMGSGTATDHQPTPTSPSAPPPLRPSAPLEVIRDPLWDNIRLDAAALRALDTPAVQRLRYIRQLGHAFLVYPGATHTRFEHALGAYHLARRAVAALEERGELECVPDDECRDDADCATDEICDAGVCVVVGGGCSLEGNRPGATTGHLIFLALFCLLVSSAARAREKRIG